MMPKMVGCLALSAVLIATACDPESDPRYNGWNRYTDADDGYVILVPPSWVVEGEMMTDMRGVRLYDQKIIAPPLSGHLYFSIFVKDLQEKSKRTLDERAHAYLDRLLLGLWCDNKIKSNPGSLAGKKAVLFDITGHDCASGIALRALVAVLNAGNKDFILFGTSTRESWRDYSDTINLLHNSFRLPPTSK
jgi:hypothetical protein